MMYSSLQKAWLFLLFFLVASVAFADPIQVPPGELPTFLSKHDNAVVMFTSLDSKCGYCTEDMRQNFSALSRRYARPGIVYAVTQWSPWQLFPSVIDKTYGINSLPQIVFFQRGQKVGGSQGYLKMEEWYKVEEQVRTEFGDKIAGSSPSSKREAPPFP